MAMFYLAGLSIVAACWLVALTLTLIREEQKDRENHDQLTAAIERQKSRRTK